MHAKGAPPVKAVTHFDRSLLVRQSPEEFARKESADFHARFVDIPIGLQNSHITASRSFPMYTCTPNEQYLNFSPLRKLRQRTRTRLRRSAERGREQQRKTNIAGRRTKFGRLANTMPLSSARTAFTDYPSKRQNILCSPPECLSSTSKQTFFVAR